MNNHSKKEFLATCISTLGFYLDLSLAFLKAKNTDLIFHEDKKIRGRCTIKNRLLTIELKNQYCYIKDFCISVE